MSLSLRLNEAEDPKEWFYEEPKWKSLGLHMFGALFIDCHFKGKIKSKEQTCRWLKRQCLVKHWFTSMFVLIC